MFKYWWVVLISAIFALGSCSWKAATEWNTSYPIEGITAYKGQDAASVLNDNGAPNSVQNLPNGRIMWIYYTNFRPVGGVELISFDQPTPEQLQTTCAVKVIFNNDNVEQVISNCQ